MSVTTDGIQLKIDGAPHFLYAGDFSYGRSPRRSWRKHLCLMRQAGINCVSFYCVWRFHEPKDNVWDFTDNHDIGAFIDLIAELGMKVIFRMGPFVHGEYRNGGYPDWLVAKLGGAIRSNNAAYLEYSKRFYMKMLEVAGPRLATDGGPIILLQLENELGSAGSKGDDIPRGSSDPEENRKHLEFYCRLVRESGIDLPFIDINRVPDKEAMMGSYLETGGCYPASCFASDGELAPFATPGERQRPCVTIETGCCMFSRFFDFPPYRNTNGCAGPILNPAQVEALAQQVVAEGASGVGFFVMSDGQHFGPDNEAMTPRRNMNYQAPITCVGNVRESYRRLKKLGWFVRAFETELVRTESNRNWADVTSFGTAHPGTATDLFAGYGAEHETGLPDRGITEVEHLSRITPGLNLSESNFLFMRNVRNTAKRWQRDIRVRTSPDRLACEVDQEFPKLVQMELPPDHCKIMPFFVKLADGVFLNHSTGTLLDRRRFGDGVQFIVHASVDEFIETRIVAPSAAQIRCGDGLLAVPASPCATTIVGRPEANTIKVAILSGPAPVHYVLVDSELAGNVWEAAGRVVFSNLKLLETRPDGGIEVAADGDAFYWYMLSPEAVRLTGDFAGLDCESNPDIGVWKFRGRFAAPPAPQLDIVAGMHGADLVLKAPVTPDLLENLEELVLRIDFNGESGEAFLDDELISDHYFGRFLGWEIGLTDWLKQPGMLTIKMKNTSDYRLEIQPVRRYRFHVLKA